MLEKIGEGKTAKEISGELGIPLSTVYYRIRKLKERGILKEKYEIDWKKLGYDVTAFVLIETRGLSISDQRKLIEKIKKMKGVVDAKIISGKYDIILQVISKDIGEFTRKLDKIKKFKEVIRTETLFVLGD